MKKVALALLVVLTVASTSFAGISYTVESGPVSIDYEIEGVVYNYTTSWTAYVDEVANSSNGEFLTFAVSISAESVNGVSSISDLYVKGDVVQSAGRRGAPTAYYEAYLDEDRADGGMLDTYIRSDLLAALSSKPDEPLTETGATWIDSCDGSYDGHTLDNGYNPGLGLGDLIIPVSSTTGDPLHATMAINAPTNVVTKLEFLQVCIPADGSVLVEGLYTNPTDAGSYPMVPFSFYVGALPGEPEPEPEPSIMVMLVVGALCLVGVRFRRK